METKDIVSIKPNFPPGIPHDCFACSKTNPYGLKMQFQGNKNTKEVFGVMNLKKEYCGFPKYVHGGILATMLDEIMAYAVNFSQNRYGVTKSLSVNYLRPVLVDQTIFIKAKEVSSRIYRKKNILSEVKAQIFEGNDDTGQLLTSATSEVVILPEKQFMKVFK